MVAGDDMATVMHIHNGDVVATAAKRSGVSGDHFVYRESLITGPVVPGDEWIETRARALTEGFGSDLLRVRTELLEQEQALDRAREREEIVLWFEHDLYCLVHLVHLLDGLRGAPLSLVWSPRPLGDCDEDELREAYESRERVSPSMQSTANEVWRDYIAADAGSLNRWLEQRTDGFPFLRDGLALHAARFPSFRLGLGRVEEILLRLIAGGRSAFAAIFDGFIAEEPRFGFGDSEIARLLSAMASSPVPLLVSSGDERSASFAITPAGDDVLSGEADNVEINPPDHWLGGVHLKKGNLWRFDGTKLNRSAV